MKVSRLSEWSSEPVSTKSNAWIEETNEDRDEKDKLTCPWPSWVTGLIIGLLLGGIGLAVALTFWFSSPSKQNTTTSGTLSTTTDMTTTTTYMSLNTWNLTINMSVGRIYHTSTYIPETNSVLLTGGSGLISTEIVDPSTGLFVSQGNMTRIRAYHTANRLSAHAVLLAGGTSVATADLYDPILGMVTGVVSMSAPRSQHTSSAIESGSSIKILLAGGQGPLATGDVYNNVTGAFSPVSNSMSIGRWAHTATTVPNGYVIIGGGRNSSTEVDSLELYNSSSNSFMPLSARMSMARYQHTATYIPSIQAILFAGGWSSINGYLKTYDLFDVPTLTFIRNGTMLSKREWFAATLLLNGLVLLIGGNDGSSYSSSCELYNPSTGNFTLAANMSFPRDYHTATVLASSNQVMVCGGQGVSGILNNCEVYSP